MSRESLMRERAKRLEAQKAREKMRESLKSSRLAWEARATWGEDGKAPGAVFYPAVPRGMTGYEMSRRILKSEPYELGEHVNALAVVFVSSDIIDTGLRTNVRACAVWCTAVDANGQGYGDDVCLEEAARNFYRAPELGAEWSVSVRRMFEGPSLVVTVYLLVDALEQANRSFRGGV